MKKVILTAVAALALVATSFAQATTAPAPMSKMGNKAKTKATDAAAPAQQAGEQAKTKAADAAVPVQQAGEKAQEMGKGHSETPSKSNGEARGEGRGEGKGGNMLGLSAEQETKFKAINEAHKAAMKAVQSNASMAADAKKAEMELLKSKYESDVQGVMNTDQFAKWKEMRAKRGERKEENDRKEGGRKSDGAAVPASAPANGTAIPAASAEGMKMKNKKKSN